MSEQLGWHFLYGDRLRDGRQAPPDGEWLVHDGQLEMCSAGLHWSETVLDALRYAPGTTLCRIEAGGDTLMDDDKRVSRQRKILWRMDASDLLGEFARWCALRVIHLWAAPDVVRQYLETGDESRRDAARAAARDAASASAWAVAWDAARADARASAWDAARDARDAAWDAERTEQNAKLTEMVMRAREVLGDE